MERRWNHRRDMMRAIALAGLLALPLPACVASSRVQPVSVTEADYVPLSKKGASWIYRTVKTGRIEGKLTIVNEGYAVFEGRASTRFSWDYGDRDGRRYDQYLALSEGQVLVIGRDVVTMGSTVESRGRFDPPLLLMKGQVLRRTQMTVPAGQFEGIEVVSKETGFTKTEWWVKGVGLIKQEFLYTSGSRVRHELVQYSIP